jgi:hypothetical protein
MSFLRRKSVLSLFIIITCVIYVNWLLNLKNLKIFKFVGRNEHLKLYKMLRVYANHVDSSADSSSDYIDSSRFLLLASAPNKSSLNLTTVPMKDLKSKLTAHELAALFRVLFVNKACLSDVSKLKLIEYNRGLTNDKLKENLTQILQLDNYYQTERRGPAVFLSFLVSLGSVDNLYAVNESV